MNTNTPNSSTNGSVPDMDFLKQQLLDLMNKPQSSKPVANPSINSPEQAPMFSQEGYQQMFADSNDEEDLNLEEEGEPQKPSTMKKTVDADNGIAGLYTQVKQAIAFFCKEGRR
jgi:hypothetical protein